LNRLPLFAALATFLVHLVANAHYGFFRDELYFIICGFRPDFGYVDQPPLVPMLAAGSQMFGPSLFAIRAVAGLFAAAGVYVTCLIVDEIGGSNFAKGLAAFLTAATPVLAAFGSVLYTDVPGLFLWPLIAFSVLRVIRGDRRWWLVAGAAFGVASEAKYTVFLYVAALMGGLILAGHGRLLANRWFAYGAVIGVLIAAPSIVWQGLHGFPILEMTHHQQELTSVVYSPAGYALQQILLTNPFFAPIWIAGLCYAFVKAELRWMGWTCVLLIGMLALVHGKNYYAGNLYPLPIAVAAVLIERRLQQTRLRLALVTACAFAALPTVPLVLPILHESQLADLVTTLRPSVSINLASNHHADASLPQDFADMHGWPQIAAAVARVYDSIPVEDRARTAILASNWGEAAAIDFYGRRYRLPPALSGANNYFLWGPRGFDGSTVVEVNGTCSQPHLFTVRHVGVAHVRDRWSMPAETGIPISVCERPRESLAAYWPRLKRYI
jgi:hypothetical protein